MIDGRSYGGPWIVQQAKAAAAELAMRLGVRTPPLAYLAFVMQIAVESNNGDPATIAWRAHNPFNLTDDARRGEWYGTTDYLVGGSATEQHSFPIFATDEDGPKNAVANYINGPEYRGVLRAFVLGDPYTIALAIQESPWSSGHYGGQLAPAVRRALDAMGGALMAKLDDEDRAWLVANILAPIIVKIDSGFNTTLPTMLGREMRSRDPLSGGPLDIPIPALPKEPPPPTG